MITTVDTLLQPTTVFDRQLLNGAVCFPRNEKEIDEFLTALWKRRQASFITFRLKLEKKFRSIDRLNSFFQLFDLFIGRSLTERRKIIEAPVFRIWYKQVVRETVDLWKNGEDVTDSLAANLYDLERITDEILFAKPVIGVPGTDIALARYGVDKWIAYVSPPTFTFPSEKETVASEKKEKFSLAFFSDVMKAVMSQIEWSWPELATTISKVIKMIIHLEEADFRSCSADRYVGIIFLTGEDCRLVDIEESLVHEFGHQLLYNVMEFDPIVINDGKVYKLPWSGSERDLYGYFHAFYIYTLLITYFVKIKNRSPENELILQERTVQILEGCKKAIVDFDGTDSFTPAGLQFYHNLKKQVEQVNNEFVVTNN